MKYIYGPVRSRRLGLSLGVSLTPYKTCSFDCIYCQLGKTTQLASQTQEYLPVRDIFDEIRLWFQNNPADAQDLNYITFSGSGEPTLNTKIGQLISDIKKFTTVPIALITNASLLSSQNIRQAISGVDLVVPSLDAVSPEVFQRIDRPDPAIKIEDVIEGLVAFRKEFKGKFWLEVMLVKGVNDDLRHIKQLKEAIDRIGPDIIQLNSPVRSPKDCGVVAVDAEKLEKIKAILGDKAQTI